MALGGSRAFSTAWGETRRGREFNRRGRRGGPVSLRISSDGEFGIRTSSSGPRIDRHAGKPPYMRSQAEVPRASLGPAVELRSMLAFSARYVVLRGQLAAGRTWGDCGISAPAALATTKKLVSATNRKTRTAHLLFCPQFTTLDRTGEPLISSSACRNWTSLSKECRTGRRSMLKR